MNLTNIKIIKFKDGNYAIRRGYFGMYGYYSINGEAFWWGETNRQQYSVSKDKTKIYKRYLLALNGPEKIDSGINVTKDFKLSVAEERLSGMHNEL